MTAYTNKKEELAFITVKYSIGNESLQAIIHEPVHGMTSLEDPPVQMRT